MYSGANGWLRLIAALLAFGTLWRFGRDFKTGRLYW